MTINVSLAGTLTANPPTSSDSSFPSAVTTVPFTLSSDPKLAQVDTGSPARNVNSPSDYAALDGIPNTVSQGTTFYLQTKSPFLLELTFAVPGQSDNVVAGIPLYGVFVIETPADQYLKLVRVMGSGFIQYYAAGNQ